MNYNPNCQPLNEEVILKPPAPTPDLPFSFLPFIWQYWRRRHRMRPCLCMGIDQHLPSFPRPGLFPLKAPEHLHTPGSHPNLTPGQVVACSAGSNLHVPQHPFVGQLKHLWTDIQTLDGDHCHSWLIQSFSTRLRLLLQAARMSEAFWEARCRL